MRTLPAAVAVLMLAGCTASSPAHQGGPPVGQATASQLREQPAHDPGLPADHLPGPADPDDAAGFAIELIVTGLVDHGLVVVDVGADFADLTLGAATVRVAATHQAGAGDPHTSVYDLDLAREPDGRWRLAGFRQAQ